MERGGLCSWCYNLDSISFAPLFQQIHSEADVTMETHEFSGALLLCLPPSSLSTIAVNMPPVRHSLLAMSICVCVRVCVSVMECCATETQWLLSSKCVFSFMQTSFTFDIPQFSKSLVFRFSLFIICNRTKVFQCKDSQIIHTICLPFYWNLMALFIYLLVFLFTWLFLRHCSSFDSWQLRGSGKGEKEKHEWQQRSHTSFKLRTPQ